MLESSGVVLLSPKSNPSATYWIPGPGLVRFMLTFPDNVERFKMKSRIALKLPGFLLLLLVVACHRDDPQPANPNQHVNDWIYSNMDYWYYWTDEIPDNPDKSLEPDAFFESLLSDKDRFSWIEDNYQQLLGELQGVQKEPGYEYALYLESGSNTNVFSQVLYVKPNSPATTAGLQRGDVIN